MKNSFLSSWKYGFYGNIDEVTNFHVVQGTTSVTDTQIWLALTLLCKIWQNNSTTFTLKAELNRYERNPHDFIHATKTNPQYPKHNTKYISMEAIMSFQTFLSVLSYFCFVSISKCKKCWKLPHLNIWITFWRQTHGKST